jgi:hypothetical protein
MKTMMTLLISFLSLVLSAQTVTVTFQGAANKNKTYQVLVDGVSYYSANSVSSNGRKQTRITDLSTGAHTLEVYLVSGKSASTIDGTTTRPSSRPVYTKTFQLREGYDMNIAVRANGQVSFTEKRMENVLSTTQAGLPMSSTAFNQLVQRVQARRYQTDRITEVRTALTATANYFTTSQVRQLLQMITAESRRLELAKLSYNKVTDPANFSFVYDVLKSEASRDALDNYVAEQGGSAVSTESNTAYAEAMPDATFTRLLTTIRKYAYQSDKIAEIRDAFNSVASYFSTAQVKQLLLLVSAETDRLALAKLAYNRVVDRGNFNQLVDIFYNQSVRADLNSFITSNGGVANNSTYTPPMAESAFTQLYNKARSHFFQKNTVAEVQAAFSNTTNNFSTEQVRALLQLVTAESTRLELAKLAYDRAVDPINYSTLLDLFTVQTNRQELDTFIRSKQ